MAQEHRIYIKNPKIPHKIIIDLVPEDEVIQGRPQPGAYDQIEGIVPPTQPQNPQPGAPNKLVLAQHQPEPRRQHHQNPNFLDKFLKALNINQYKQKFIDEGVKTETEIKTKIKSMEYLRNMGLKDLDALKVCKAAYAMGGNYCSDYGKALKQYAKGHGLKYTKFVKDFEKKWAPVIELMIGQNAKQDALNHSNDQLPLKSPPEPQGAPNQVELAHHQPQPQPQQHPNHLNDQLPLQSPPQPHQLEGAQNQVVLPQHHTHCFTYF